MRAARVIAITLAVMLSASAVAGAAGGTYVVESCRTANGPASSQSWVARAVPADVNPSTRLFTDACRNGGMVHYELSPLGQDGLQASQWIFEAAEGTSIVGLDLWRYAAVIDASQSARYRLFADNQVLEASPDQAPWEFGTFGAGDVVSASGLRAGRVGVEMGCAEDVEPCGGDAINLTIARAAVTLSDASPPEAVGLPSGRLFSGLSMDGLVDARLGFRDSGGGVAGVELKVDGVSRGIEHVGGPDCVPPYVVRVPCAVAGNVTMVLDTAQLRDGAHTVEFVLTDVAGNRSVVGPFGISVRSPATQNSTAPPVPALHENPETGQVPAGTLSLAGKSKRRIKFVSTKITGGLAGPGATALAGQRVDVRTRPLLGGTWSAATIVSTDAKGRFSVSLPPGPSREIRLAYGDSVQTVKLIVAAPVRLATNRKATRNGRTVKFSGTVPGAGAARTRVELQAWAGRWVPFKTAALRNGRFSATYRFTSTYATTRYRFRAVIHGDDDFPYADGKSPEVKVVVRP